MFKISLPIEVTLRTNLAKRCDKQRTIPPCIKFNLSELKNASIRLQNNKFSLKNIRLKALLPADKEEVNFLYVNNLPKGA